MLHDHRRDVRVERRELRAQHTAVGGDQRELLADQAGLIRFVHGVDDVRRSPPLFLQGFVRECRQTSRVQFLLVVGCGHLMPHPLRHRESDHSQSGETDQVNAQ